MLPFLISSGNEAKEDFTNFLKSNAIWLCVALVVLIILTIVCFLFFNRSKNTKK